MLISVLRACLALAPLYPTREDGGVVEAMFRTLCDSTPDLQDAGAFRRCVHRSIAAWILEPGISGNGDVGFMDRVGVLRGLVGKLEGRAGIPSTEALRRYSETFRLLRVEHMEDVNCADGLRGLWPEVELGDDEAVQRFATELMTARLRIWLFDYSTVFLVGNGCLGKVSNYFEPGDELWLICQARVPFVLRPVPGRGYKLMGEAFVHGAMYGEFIKDAIAQEPRQIAIIWV